MPRTFDRTQPVTDKDPLRFGTDYLDPFGAIADGATEYGGQIRNGLVTVIKDLTGIDLTGVVEFLGWLSEQLGLDDLVAWVGEVGNFLGEVAGQIADAIKQAFDWLGEALGLDELWADIQEAAAGIGDFITGGIAGALDAIKQAFDWFSDALGLDDVWETLQDAATGVGGFIFGVADSLGDLIGKLLDNAGNFVANIGGAILDGIATVGQFLANLWDSFTGGSGSSNKTVANVASAASTVRSTASGADTKATSALNNNENTNRAIYNGYFGAGASGTSTEVQATVEAIKTKLDAGYTLETLTFNSAARIYTLTLVAIGGTYTLSYGGQTTSSLSSTASAATVQSALTGLTTIGAGKATVTGATGGGGIASGPFTITLDTSLAPFTALTATSSLTGTPNSIQIQPTHTWTRPWEPGDEDEPKEFWAVCVGAGQGGGAGSRVAASSGAVGGTGGAGGGYSGIQIDPADIGSTVNYSVGLGGLGRAGSTNLTAVYPAGQTSFGSFIETIAGRAYISSLFGYYTADDSQPGSGGNGGAGVASPGLAGGSTPLAAGGAGGTSAQSGVSVVGNGSNGATADVDGINRAGGGGGGGGGGSYTTTSLPTYNPGNGGNGGNGGFPGAGGGGGGGVNDQRNIGLVAGSGGTGAHGVIILLWK